VKTVSEMTYTVSGGALNSTQSNPKAVRPGRRQPTQCYTRLSAPGTDCNATGCCFH